MSGLRLGGLDRWPAASRRRAGAAVRRAVKAAGADGLGLGVSFVSDDEMRELNRTWRGKDAATDVLSFAAHDGEVLAGLEDELGDLVISVDTARRQAAALGHPALEELSVLVVHGLLHLCGLDHEDGPAEARAMAELELSVLHRAGVPVERALVGRSLG